MNSLHHWQELLVEAAANSPDCGSWQFHKPPTQMQAAHTGITTDTSAALCALPPTSYYHYLLPGLPEKEAKEDTAWEN